MPNKSKNISFKPIPLAEDEDIDPNKSLDVSKINKTIKECFDLAIRKVEDIFYIEDPKGLRFELKNIISGMKDTHEVICEIYRKYASEEKSKNLCAIPLVRTQVESIYILALIFRDPKKWLSEFRSYSCKRFYHRKVYEFEERKNLKNQGVALKNIIIKNKDFLRNNSFTSEELEEIEDKVRKGDPSITGFPGVKRIIEKIHSADASDPILNVLKRFYIEYMWLSSYTHGITMAGYNREICYRYSRLTPNQKLILENEIRDPFYMLNYLAILIVLTDLQKVIKNSEKLRVCLSKAWEQFEGTSLLSKFVWNNWAKSVMKHII